MKDTRAANPPIANVLKPDLIGDLLTTLPLISPIRKKRQSGKNSCINKYMF
jgi:hypothetical protein